MIRTIPFGCSLTYDFVPQNGKGAGMDLGVIQRARFRVAVRNSSRTVATSVSSASTSDFRKSAQTASRISDCRSTIPARSASSKTSRADRSGGGPADKSRK